MGVKGVWGPLGFGLQGFGSSTERWGLEAESENEGLVLWGVPLLFDSWAGGSLEQNLLGLRVCMNPTFGVWVSRYATSKPPNFGYRLLKSAGPLGSQPKRRA